MNVFSDDDSILLVQIHVSFRRTETKAITTSLNLKINNLDDYLVVFVDDK